MCALQTKNQGIALITAMFIGGLVTATYGQNAVYRDFALDLVQNQSDNRLAKETLTLTAPIETPSFDVSFSNNQFDSNDSSEYIRLDLIIDSNNSVDGFPLTPARFGPDKVSINAPVVPLPPSALAGFGLLGCIAGVRCIRRR